MNRYPPLKTIADYIIIFLGVATISIVLGGIVLFAIPVSLYHKWRR